MKQKLILTCAAAAVPALLYALYRRWWKHACGGWLYFYRCSVC